MLPVRDSEKLDSHPRLEACARVECCGGGAEGGFVDSTEAIEAGRGSTGAVAGAGSGEATSTSGIDSSDVRVGSSGVAVGSSAT